MRADPVKTAGRAPIPERESVPAGLESGVLTNGTLRTVLARDGTGGTSLGPIALIAESHDPVEGRGGCFLYLRDLASRAFWSLGREPIPGDPDEYHAGFRGGLFEIVRREHGIEARLEACVAPGLTLEIRRVTLRNRSRQRRRIEVTSFAEVVLDRAAAHAAHPAFSKLFLETAYVARDRALLVRRRPREAGAHHPWLVHALLGNGGTARVEFETDRERFIGRGRDITCPLALSGRGPLTGSAGNVLDPIVSLRCAVTLAAGGSAALTFLLGAADDRAPALALARHDARDLALVLERAAAAPRPDGAPSVSAAPRARVTPGAPPSPRPPRDAARRTRPRAPRERLRFFNGYGGFSEDGREYVIRLAHRPGRGLERPPAPWINVLANESFGSLVSETGAGCTWSRNSREWRLTPWSNDPLADPHGEAVYVRDEESGEFWSVFPGPSPAAADYETRHGFGVTRFGHTSHGLEHEACVFVPRSVPVRIVRLRLSDHSGRPRRLSLFAYQRLVLGAEPGARTIETEWDARDEILLARNPAGGAYANGVAFAAVVPDAGRRATRFTTDRAAFLGERGRPARPEAVASGAALDGTAGAPDACFALQQTTDLAANGTLEVAFLLGEGSDPAEARALVRSLRGAGAIETALDDTREFWDGLVSGVRIRTPRPVIDVMVNGWLAYQTVACRLWARSAFYQSGGAFGYRDQLQDAVALTMHSPELARRQILLHAAHQFVEGDVLHWWHPPNDRGIRTRFADDLLWLPYLTADYLEVTGDWGLLEERAPFLRARTLEAGEDEAFLEPRDSGAAASVYEHCCRAIDRSLATGRHGLPLFGTGDWNDGMNRVGREGRGESVWMGFFLHALLGRFASVCERRGDGGRTRRYRACREALRLSLDAGGWDGGWYRRGYYDDGTPLGSRKSEECRIDALVQAWSVISGAASPARARRAMNAVREHLVSERHGIIRLLAPPFSHTDHDPGYIKGYAPGVRENGGQYTHAALWVVRALAELGRRDEAARALEMLSPVSHAATRRGAERYRVEPYVIAADVCGVGPLVGRGGWTWYTGSAGWMLRVTLESVLGVRLEGGDTLRIAPRIPDRWPGFHVSWRIPGEATTYEIQVRNPKRRARRAVSATLDGEPAAVQGGAACVQVARDGRVHHVNVVLG